MESETFTCFYCDGADPGCLYCGGAGFMTLYERTERTTPRQSPMNRAAGKQRSKRYGYGPRRLCYRRSQPQTKA